MGAWSPWDNRSYCRVVICKNKKAHRETNVLFGHKIPLVETDSLEPMPVSGSFLVQCDECGEEHAYMSRRKLCGLNSSFPNPSRPIRDSDKACELASLGFWPS